jgi:hypothetical protein
MFDEDGFGIALSAAQNMPLLPKQLFIRHAIRSGLMTKSPARHVVERHF